MDSLPYLSDHHRATIINHIRDYAKSKGIYIDHITGLKDHMHSLISMSAEQIIETIMNLLKGESSHWINKQNLIQGKFSWQDEYFAVSIGDRKLIQSENIFGIRKFII
jgi:REP element-mobilizing transposase RayT